MTFGVHKLKSDDPKLNKGEFLILCKIKELMLGFTTPKKKTPNAAGLLFIFKKMQHTNLLTTVPPKACPTAT